MGKESKRTWSDLEKDYQLRTQLHYIRGKQGFRTMDFNIKIQLKISNP